MSTARQSRRNDHAADTRSALVAAARSLFATRGFANTGTEEIVAAARVTRGALYHHFRDKADLFAVVMEQVAQDVATQLIDTGTDVDGSPLGEIRAGFAAFLELCVGSDFQRIVLVDGPSVLGEEAWERLVETHGLSLLTAWLSRAVTAGEIDPLPEATLARLLMALLTEASLAIGRADQPAVVLRQMAATLDRLLVGLAPRAIQPPAGGP